MKVLGMISGTSVDAIDVAVADFAADGDTLLMTPLKHGEVPWPDTLRDELLGALSPATSGVETWCRLDTEVGRALGAACAPLAQKYGVDLISSHGQTLFHWADGATARGTLQVGNPAWIHAATGVPVISDLRTADIAAGGHGAPLASTLDALWLADVPTVALNLGGIANITVVAPGQPPISGDTGPASALLDAAAVAHDGRPADLDGALALAGTVDSAALDLLLADPFYALPLPKSSGREYFHSAYVAERLAGRDLTGPDLFATLTELTARTVADAVGAYPEVERVVASGGGMRNPALVAGLHDLLPVPLLTTDELGLASDAKEAYLFALLGFLSAHGLPGTISGATGAHAPVVLGSLTPPVGLISSASKPVTWLRVVTQEDR